MKLYVNKSDFNLKMVMRVAKLSGMLTIEYDNYDIKSIIEVENRHQDDMLNMGIEPLPYKLDELVNIVVEKRMQIDPDLHSLLVEYIFNLIDMRYFKCTITKDMITNLIGLEEDFKMEELINKIKGGVGYRE